MKKIIEIIGPSGVGKTYFLKKIEASIKQASNWHSQTALQNINFYEVQQKDFANILINLVEKYLAHTESEYNRKILSFLTLRIYQDRFLNQESNQKIILDDGIVHNLTAILLKQENQILAKRLFSERNFILLESNTEKILQNYYNRNNESPSNLNNWCRIYNNDLCTLKNKIKQDSKNSSNLASLAEKCGATVLKIDLALNFQSNLTKVIELMSNNNINYLDKEKFYKLANSIKSGHWKSQPLELRWSYHSRALEVLKSIGIEKPSDVLEIGTVGVQLIANSDTLDQDIYWNYEGKEPTFTHDARDIPWPIQRKYKAIVALRVFQYLVPKQKEAFLEAKRLTENLIIVVPSGEAYRPAGLENSIGVKYEDFITWNDGIKPDLFEETSMGDFYYWKFN